MYIICKFFDRSDCFYNKKLKNEQKVNKNDIFLFIFAVAPHWGAGIEIKTAKLWEDYAESLPTGERGLKFLRSGIKDHYYTSRSPLGSGD